MKTLIAIAALALVLASCTKEMPQISQSQDQKIFFRVESVSEQGTVDYSKIVSITK